LNSPTGQGQIARKNRQGVKAGLNFDDIRTLTIPVPPTNEQHDFARRVKVVEKLKATQRASLGKLAVLFTSLQHRAFRGEL
jgi:type I restriction enzyme S subunit